MAAKFKCPICGNEDERKLGIRNGQIYCRACLTFAGEPAKLDEPTPKSAFFHLDYDLTINQNDISNALLSNYIKRYDTLLFAVTGAGKTEIVFKVIRYVIEKGGKVGFAIPRRDVVHELYQRIKEVYKLNKVVEVFGGNTEELDGDIICLTTHQLYRYPHVFDLLIVDEIDAFPYDGNQVLESILFNAIKGNLIMMSATPSEKIIKKFKRENARILTLNKRHHGYPLPVPEVMVYPFFLKYIYLLFYVKKFIDNNKQIFIFTPTISACESLYKFISLFIKSGTYVHSKRIDRTEVISDFKANKYSYIVTTAVLERGVTVKDLQVIVFQADSSIYSDKALVQISGRVGRKTSAPEGRVIFLVDHINDAIKKSVETIKKSNNDLQSLF